MMNRHIKKSAVAFSALMFSMFAYNLIASDYYVSAGGSIQAAVDQAVDGDTVTLAAGTFNLTAGIDLGFSAITVRSESGRDVTIVNGQDHVRCFHLRNGFAQVKGLTIRNGKAPVGDNGYRYGGGVYCEGGGIVDDCIVENCSADYGGGIRIHTLGLVKDSIVRNCRSTTGPDGDGGGGGIHVYLDGQVYDTTVYGNSAQDSGGGIKLSHGGLVQRCTVYNNSCDRYGGGIYCFEGGDVSESTIYNNRAEYGGGIRLFWEKGSIPSASRCKIYNNTTSGGNGAGIHVGYKGTVENCVIYDNIADGNGGGVYMYKGGTLHSCTIVHNGTLDKDGNGAGDGKGGGVYTSGNASIKNCVIFWNTSETTANHNTQQSTDRYDYCLTYPQPTGGTGNIFGTPGFVDGNAHNYYLKPDSVLIDAGGTTSSPTNDFAGVHRPLDGTGDNIQKFDIGAYEYWGADDIDRDGMPTYWELLHGLDPSDPADGTNVVSDPPEITDRDGDHLFNIEEYQHGTDPNNADTDGDGISDWKEINGRYPSFPGHITDPTKADTDGDGFSDKYEIDNDSNPTNALSYLTSLFGTVTYNGTVQTGQVVVLVSNANVKVRTTIISGPGGYTTTNVPTLEPLVVTAFRDSDGDGAHDSWEAYGEYTNNPVTLTGPTPAINIVIDEPTTDSDGDGLSDFFEVYTSLTDPYDEDTDGDSMPDGWEWGYRPIVNPTNALDKTEDPDSDNLKNFEEYQAHSDPGNPDTDGDSMPDGWEWANRPATDPTNALDAQIDFEPDGLVNSNEYVIGTNPNMADTDGDTMPDGWEARYIPTLSPTNAADKTEDPDYDNLQNYLEFGAGTDPTVVDTDGDGMPDGWEFGYPHAVNPTNSADRDLDYEPDNLSNYSEYVHGTNPELADTDGDGVSDGDEVAAGTDPTDPNSFPVSISGTLNYSGVQTGVYYAVASQQPTGRVYQTSAITNAGAYIIENVAMFTNYYVTAFLDSNGNASQDVWEASGIFSDSNGVPVMLYLTNIYTGADISLSNPTNDSDGDGLMDSDEHYVYGTDPLLWDTDGDSMPDGWEVTYTNACDPLDPADRDLDFDLDGLSNSNEYVHGTNPELRDTDGDGLFDQYEVDISRTDPTIADTDGDGLNDGEENGIPPDTGYGTDPNNPDTDGDGLSDGKEVEIGSDPLNKYSFPATISGELIYTNGLSGSLFAVATDGVRVWTNEISAPGAYAITNLPTLTNYTVSAFLDSNTNMVKDTWEAQGVYSNNPIWFTNSYSNADVILTHPTVDTDHDGLSDYDEVNLYNTDPNDPDTDGDSMWDGWEATYSNAVDPLIADGQTDFDSDNLSSSNEFVWGTNPENPDTDADGMPDGWETIYTNAVNPTNGLDGAEDYVGETNASGAIQLDGLVNSNEYKYGTSPEAYDTDGDGYGDGDEVAAGTDPTDPNSFPVRISGTLSYTGSQGGPVYAVLTEGTNSTSNVVVLAGTSGAYTFGAIDTLRTYTITGYRDSNTNNMLDTWEASGSYSNNPIDRPTNSVTGVDFEITDPVNLDSDGDGLTDMDEVYKYNTLPDNPDTDGDLMPDGWEVAHSNAVDVLVADGTNDFDADGLINSNEYVAHTDPANVDSDGDSMWDGWEFLYPAAVNPTNPADALLDVDLPQPDGLVNSNEFVWRTNPEVEDTDGDGMPDGWETIYTNAVNPTNGLDGAEDYVGETNASGAIQLDGLVNSNEYKYGTSPEAYDTDGDGFGDGDEVAAGTDPTDPASYPVNVTALIANNTQSRISGDTYFVLNLSSNGNEFASSFVGTISGGGAIVGTVSNVPNLTTYYPYAYIDINSNGTYELFEPYGVSTSGRDSITPTNNLLMGFISIKDSHLDTDSDDLSDYDEEYIYHTSYTNADTDADGFNDGEEVQAKYPSDPNNPASFHANFSGETSYTGVLSGTVNIWITNSVVDSTNVPINLGSFVTATNYPTLTNYYLLAYIDENANNKLDLWEPRGTADANPIYLGNNVSNINIIIKDAVTDTDGDGLSDYFEHYVSFSDATTNDTDGDGMLDGWEWKYKSVMSLTNAADSGEDPDGDGLTNLQEHNLDPQTDPTKFDTDGDGLSDGDEVNTYSTEPTIADTDGDGMPDGWEVTYMPPLDPLTPDAYNDPDNDGLWNLQEYHDSKTDPTDEDTDGDGLTDYEEYITYGTMPTNTDTDADGFDDYDEVMNIGSMATNAIDPWVVDDNAPGDPVAGNPNISDPNENGSLATPYDAIQEAVDAAQPGYTVLVLDGTYSGHGNGDVNPGGKAITIRSRNGYAATKIRYSAGGGFICETSEGTNTVIQGFTVQTRVVELGAAGVTCSNASPTIIDCNFFDCGEAGVLCQEGSAAIISDCIFNKNQGGIKIDASSPTVERCTMRLNVDVNGGGVKISGASKPHIVNCEIVQNDATSKGGGIYIGADSNPVIINCTVADNTATNAGGGFFNAGDLVFWNCILWGNQAPEGPGYSLSNRFESGYCCLQTEHLGGLNNIVADPRFTGGGHYELISASPCVDAGIDQQSGNHAPEDDHDGKERIFTTGGSSKYDIGAYEYYSGGRVTVQNPGDKSGEVLTAGLPSMIEWTWESGVSSNLTLSYTYDFLSQSPVWHTIATNVYRGDTNGVDSGSGSYSWTVPQTNTSRCYVRVSDSTNANINGVSSFEFGIADGMRVLNPNGGETFYIGNTVDVAWVSSATTNSAVNLTLKSNGNHPIGQSVMHVGGGATNSTNWVIETDNPGILTTNGLMKVEYEDGSLFDESDDAFSILGLVITQPVGGSVLETGTVVDVRWDSIGAGSSVDIVLSTNAGASYFVLTNGVASVDGSNTYSWTVGSTPSSNAILRIQSEVDTNVLGYTGEFKIRDGVTVFGESDVDGDGMSDEYEESVGLDYENGSGEDGANGDPDGDGFNNASEMFAGTLPMDPESFIGILSLDEQAVAQKDSATKQSFVVRWSAVKGHDYRVESATDLVGPWNDVSGTITADDTEMSWSTNMPVSSSRFFRIIVL